MPNIKQKKREARINAIARKHDLGLFVTHFDDGSKFTAICKGCGLGVTVSFFGQHISGDALRVDCEVKG